jgi:hypothetical protein
VLGGGYYSSGTMNVTYSGSLMSDGNWHIEAKNIDNQVGTIQAVVICAKIG